MLEAVPLHATNRKKYHCVSTYCTTAAAAAGMAATAGMAAAATAVGPTTDANPVLVGILVYQHSLVALAGVRLAFVAAQVQGTKLMIGASL